MLILHVTYQAKPGMRDAFRKAIEAEGLDAASRAEDGNYLYEYSEEEDQPDVLYLGEIWETVESQKAHSETPHFKRLGELKGQYVENTEIQKYDLDFAALEQTLADKGYAVSAFDTAAEAMDYLDQKIDGLKVGVGGSKTLEDMGLYNRLSSHNEVNWHWHPADGQDAQATRLAAMQGDVYLASANAISEAGEIVNSDGSGNRLAGTLFGHSKVYFVMGVNKICPTLADAIDRLFTVAAPTNAKRLGIPLDEDGGARSICRAMTVTYGPMVGQETEIVLIKQFLGM